MIDRKLSRKGRKFSGRRRWQSSLRAPSTMWRAREATLERRRKRARWWRTSLLSCSIGKVRSLPVNSCSSGISRWKPSQSSVRKTLPSIPILSSSRRQVASSRPPSSQARVRRATGSQARQSRTLFFPVHEVPHLVDLDDAARRRGRGRRRLLAGLADPLVDREVADPEQLGDHALADVAQGVEQHRQRPHRRRPAAGRRGREAAAARLAAVALMAVRHAVPEERSTAAMLAAKLGHGHLLAQGHERGGKRYLLNVKCLGERHPRHRTEEEGSEALLIVNKGRPHGLPLILAVVR